LCLARVVKHLRLPRHTHTHTNSQWLQAHEAGEADSHRLEPD
jgi:hypothetical protein